MAYFADLATRNFTILLAGILTGSPVAGLRPPRAFRSTRTKRPTPGIANTPDFWERSAISDRTNASRFETPSLSAVSRTEGGSSCQRQDLGFQTSSLRFTMFPARANSRSRMLIVRVEGRREGYKFGPHTPRGGASSPACGFGSHPLPCPGEPAIRSLIQDRNGCQGGPGKANTGPPGLTVVRIPGSSLQARLWIPMASY